MELHSLVALLVLTALALIVRFTPQVPPSIAPSQAERSALEWVGSGRVTHRRRMQREGREVYRVLVRDNAGNVHELDVCSREGRVISERLAA
jgi:hypothetical protein